MDQAVYAENGERRARSGRIIAWAVTFTLLQIVSLVAVMGLAAWKMPFFNQELNSEGLRNRCIIPSKNADDFPGPKGETLHVDAKFDQGALKEGVVDKDGNKAISCQSDSDCADPGAVCGTLTPSTALLKDVEYKLAQERGGKVFAKPIDKFPFAEPNLPPYGFGGWGAKGSFLVALTPAGLMPPFLLFIIALAVGIPLQRRAMRHVNAVQISDSERSQLLAETKRMGADGDDRSRIGRLIAAGAGAVVLLAIAYPVFMGGAWAFSGFHDVNDGEPHEIIRDGKSLGFKQETKTEWSAEYASASFDVTSSLKSPQFDSIPGGCPGGRCTLAWKAPKGFDCDDPNLSATGKTQCSSWVSSQKFQSWVFVFPALVSLIGLFPFMPILPLLGARLIGVPLQRKANQGLVVHKISPAEQAPLAQEMERDGARQKGFLRSLGAKMVGATSVGTLLAFLLLMLGILVFMVIAEAMLPAPIAGETQDAHLDRLPHPLLGMWPFLVLQLLITMAPFILGRLAGVPVYRSAKEMQNAGVIPITPQERAQYEAEFYKTNLFVKRIRSKRMMKMAPAFAVCAAPMVVLFVVAWLVVMAVHMPTEFTFLCLFLFLPTSIPLVIGLLPSIPMRRKVKDDGLAV